MRALIPFLWALVGSLAVTAGGSFAFHGRVGIDFLTTGLVATVASYGMFVWYTAPLRAALKSSRTELEARVEARTRELVDALARLRTESEARHEAERALRKKERLTGGGAWLAGIAHELRNPLSATIGNLELLRDELPDPSLGEVAHDALAGAEQVRRVIGDLTTATATHEGEIGRADEAAAAAGRLVGWQVRKVGSLTVDAEPDVPVPLAASRLVQVFVNLLVNAAQASRAEAPNHVRLTVRRAGDRVVATVADTGAGMPSDVLARVFEPAFTTKGDRGGSGLGMAIVRELVEGARGTVALASREGEGTTVTLSLPLAR